MTAIRRIVTALPGILLFLACGFQAAAGQPAETAKPSLHGSLSVRAGYSSTYDHWELIVGLEAR